MPQPAIVMTVTKTLVMNQYYNFKMVISYAPGSAPVAGPATISVDTSWGLAHWPSGGTASGPTWHEGTPTASNFVMSDPYTYTIPSGSTPPLGQPIAWYDRILVVNTTSGMSAHTGPFCATAHLSANPSGTNGQVCVNF
jgi:hypothetical protein